VDSRSPALNHARAFSRKRAQETLRWLPFGRRRNPGHSPCN
jgi:hypothetical protein